MVAVQNEKSFKNQWIRIERIMNENTRKYKIGL
jgi:hypothetical protein